MKIARYSTGSGAAYGIVEGDTLFAASGDLLGGLTKGAEVGKVADAKLLAPLDPGKIVCIGLNYALHAKESGVTELPKEPVVFMKPPSAVIGPGETIELANPENQTDYEAELAIVIGKKAKDVEPGDALGYIFGYTAANDVSDRNLQFGPGGQWIRAKGFDTYCPLGPVIATDIEPGNLKIGSKLNGEQRQNSNTNDLIFDVPTLISFLSKIMTLNPGDVVLTGTPEKVGGMKPGDVIEVEVEGIGSLTNPVAAR
ncbi:MAG: fumarylacetoacetate hydrolase family protein [Thermomicrobiales bacterium]|nr:fumarylacetoacetate hydrolase family protein [Thermomicrobiales bacterium]